MAKTIPQGVNITNPTDPTGLGMVNPQVQVLAVLDLDHLDLLILMRVHARMVTIVRVKEWVTA
jgi:hypothetical protein